MFAELVDDTCASLSGSQPECPFGPDTKVWTIGRRVFAVHMMNGKGVSVACGSQAAAQIMVTAGLGLAPPYLKSEGWVLLPYGWHAPDRLRAYIHDSYTHVRHGLPGEVKLLLPPAATMTRH